MRARFQPRAVEDRLERVGRGDDDIGIAHCRFGRGRGRHSAMRRRKMRRMLRRAAPHADLVIAMQMRQCFEMRLRLDAAAEQCEHLRLRRREVFRRRRRDRGGAHLGDEPPVHDRERLAGLRPKQQDHRHMRRHGGAGILRIKADELQPHRVRRHRRHDAEIALFRLDRQHLAYRLQHAALRELRERLFHRRDQPLPAQQLRDPRLIEKHHHAGLPRRRNN